MYLLDPLFRFLVNVQKVLQKISIVAVQLFNKKLSLIYLQLWNNLH